MQRDVRRAAWGRDYGVLGQSLENQGLGWAEMGLQKEWSIERASWQERGTSRCFRAISQEPFDWSEGAGLEDLEKGRDGRATVVLGSRIPIN